MLAVEPILQGLKADGAEVMLTTTTSTGYRLAKDRYRGLVCAIGYFPIDWVPFSARAWSAIDPDMAIVTEGERWPEHLFQARRRSVPVLCINARISDEKLRAAAPGPGRGGLCPQGHDPAPRRRRPSTRAGSASSGSPPSGSR